MWSQPQEIPGPGWEPSSVPTSHLTQEKLRPKGGGLRRLQLGGEGQPWIRLTPELVLTAHAPCTGVSRVFRALQCQSSWLSWSRVPGQASCHLSLAFARASSHRRLGKGGGARNRELEPQQEGGVSEKRQVGIPVKVSTGGRKGAGVWRGERVVFWGEVSEVGVGLCAECGCSASPRGPRRCCSLF